MTPCASWFTKGKEKPFLRMTTHASTLQPVDPKGTESSEKLCLFVELKHDPLANDGGNDDDDDDGDTYIHL
jgi:hypothetical protein